MKTEIKFGDQAINLIAKGVETLALTVGSTLGPGGRNVIFDFYGYPKVTKDGVTVANNINLPDPWENIGAQMVKNVARQTCIDAGDGTTTATILADEIISQGVKTILSKNNPISVQRGIEKATNCVIDFIESNIKQSVTTDNEVRKVAILSSNWDDEIGNVVADAIIEVGEYGSIEIEDASGTETSVKFRKGIKFDRGFINPALAQDKSRLKTVFDKPNILLCKGEFNFVNEIIPLLELLRSNNSSLVIVADSFGNDFLSTIIINKLNVTCLKAPHYRDMRLNTMEDLAVLFGTEYFDFAHGDVGIHELEATDLGSCDQVIQTGTTTTFIGGAGDPDEIKECIKEIHELSQDDSADELHRENAKLRLKQLNSKAATILVGSSTETENSEKRDRIDDAIHAVRAAMKDGIVPGGSYSYIKAVASKCLDKLEKVTKNQDELAGIEIIRKALVKPFFKLLQNAGLEQESWKIFDKISKSKRKNYGYDVKQQKMCDLIDAGVVDPWTVTKQALKNAASVAGLILSSNSVILQIEEPKHVVQTQPSLPSM